MRPPSPRSTSSPGTIATAALDELSPQALSILQTAFARAGLPASRPAILRRPGLPPLTCAHVERPPLADLRVQRRRRRASA